MCDEPMELEIYLEDLPAQMLDAKLMECLVRNKAIIGDWNEIGNLIERFHISLDRSSIEGTWSASFDYDGTSIYCDGNHPHTAVACAVISALTNASYGLVLSKAVLSKLLPENQLQYLEAHPDPAPVTVWDLLRRYENGVS